jgi:rfaE bifunctional protein kinase chain/domain
MSRYVVSRARFLEIVSQIATKKILILGDVGIDRYTMGTAVRLSQEAPVPVVAVSTINDKLGLAANVADNIKSFGATPILASMIGPDRHGEELLALLSKNQISSGQIFSHSSRRTTLKERVIAQNQQVVRIDHEKVEPLTKEAEDYFCDKIRPLLQIYDGIILEDYAKGVLTDGVLRFVIEEARKEKKFISVDPPTMGNRDPGLYRGVSLITPNTDEAGKLSGIPITDEASLVRAGNFLLKQMDVPIVVVTRGKAGMTVFTKNAEPLTVPTFARAVYDVSGAGDTVISMLTLALLSGATLEEAALLSNFAAGVEVGKPGTATVSIAELEEYMQLLGGIA